MTAPRIRELRAIDIRCPAKSCGAGPGEPCRTSPGSDPGMHWFRIQERDLLAADGWLWQEVDPTDKGAR